MTILARRHLLLGLAAALPALSARADDDDDCRGGISRAQAVAIARAAGVVRVEEVECDDDEWEVEGRDIRGRKIEVEISARTGRIREIDRDD
jgi:uncharacterized membrane protein YkoI